MTDKKVGILGLMAVCFFIVTFFVFAGLNPEFNIIEDYVSRLGAKNQPHAIWFNIFGFLLTGILLIGFGLLYGKFLNDWFAGILLAIFGVGFSFTAIPFNIDFADSPVSKAHTMAITLGLASWLFGLARISYNKLLKKSIRVVANITAILLVSSMIGFVIDLWSMPFTHRLVFGVVFGWTAFTSAGLILKSKKSELINCK